MRQSLGLVSLVVRDYDEALEFYVGKLGFELVEDSPVHEQAKLWRDYERCRAKGVEFVRPPAKHAYGTVAVFKDLYGNLWDLLQPA